MHSGAKRIGTHSIRALGATFRAALPLPARKRLAVALGKRHFKGQFHFVTAMLRDFSQLDANNYHRFLWSNHLAYAATYNVDRFGGSNIEPSRKLLLSAVATHINPDDVRSVLELGCSTGYLLRYMETAVFTKAFTLTGIDIDRYAIEAGSGYLASLPSKAKLICSDMTRLDEVVQGRQYDLIVCCGTLMYLDEETASRVVASILSRTRHLAAFLTLSHPTVPNSHLHRSSIRESDGAFVHNIDAMIRRSGGRAITSSWERPRTPDQSAAYSTIASPTKRS